MSDDTQRHDDGENETRTGLDVDRILNCLYILFWQLHAVGRSLGDLVRSVCDLGSPTAEGARGLNLLLMLICEAEGAHWTVHNR